MRDVSLSAADAAALEAMASSHVREAIQQALYHRSDPSPDPSRWKRGPRYRDLALYRERLPYAYRERKVGPRLFADPALVPAALLTGAVRGDLDNLMLGLLAPAALRQKYVGRADAAVQEQLLATIVGPSFHDPLRSLTLVWRGRRRSSRRRYRPHRNCPQPAGGDDRRTGRTCVQDLVGDLIGDGTVLLRSTGVAHLPDGERVGYELVHSVALAVADSKSGPPHPHPHLHPVRSLDVHLPKLSYCSVYRQRGRDAVEVFSLGAATPRLGERLAAAGADAGPNKMRALPRIEACGRAKKLAWLLAAAGEPATLSAASAPCAARVRTSCASCFRPFPAASGLGRTLGRLARLRGRAGMGMGTECSVCSDVVCGRCLLSRRVRSVRWDKADACGRGCRAAVDSRSVPFCAKCVRRADELSAVTVAAHAVLDADDAPTCGPRSGRGMDLYGWGCGQATPTCSSAKSTPPEGHETFFCIDNDDQVQEIPACDPRAGAEEDCDAIEGGPSLRTWGPRWHGIADADERTAAVSDVDDRDLWTLESLDVAVLGDDAFQI